MRPIVPTLTANINYYRTLYKVPQKTLVGALGISRPTFNRRCQNEGFTVKELRIIARILKTDIHSLLKGV